MREGKKSKEKNTRKWSAVNGKWPYYVVMNILEYYLQRKLWRCSRDSNCNFIH